MAEKGKTGEKRYEDSERLLEEARKEAKYYQSIAEEAGKKRLQEINQLSRLISARNQAEEALRESEEKYRNLVERANDGIAIVKDNLLKYLNPRLAEIGGYTADEVIDN